MAGAKETPRQKLIKGVNGLVTTGLQKKSSKNQMRFLIK
jgi:hypothetical protein